MEPQLSRLVIYVLDRGLSWRSAQVTLVNGEGGNGTCDV